MKKRRPYLLLFTAGVVTLAVTVTPVIAAELLGMITKVDVEEGRLTIVEKESDKEIHLKIDAETKYVTKKGASKLDLEKLAKIVAKSKDSGKKGISVKVTHSDDIIRVLYIDPKGP